jgi:hypothetical protein
LRVAVANDFEDGSTSMASPPEHIEALADRGVESQFVTRYATAEAAFVFAQARATGSHVCVNNA